MVIKECLILKLDHTYGTLLLILAFVLILEVLADLVPASLACNLFKIHRVISKVYVYGGLFLMSLLFFILGIMLILLYRVIITHVLLVLLMMMMLGLLRKLTAIDI